MESSGQIHVPDFYSPTKQTPNSLQQGAVWAQSRS